VSAVRTLCAGRGPGGSSPLSGCASGSSDEAVSRAKPARKAAPLERPADACGRLLYGGRGAPDVAIVSDLYLNGPFRSARQSVRAIRRVLERRGWRAGGTSVGLFSCREQWYDWPVPYECGPNAKAYVKAPRIVGVIGTNRSRCDDEQLPVLNKGGVPHVGFASRYACFTVRLRGCGSRPFEHQPTGVRTFVRVMPNLLVQSAALALLAAQRGVRRAYVLHDGYVENRDFLARPFRAVARAQGIEVVGFRRWTHTSPTSEDVERGRYLRLMREIRAARADAVVVAGLYYENSAQLLKDKVAVLGPNTRRVALLVADAVEPWLLRRARGAGRGLVYVVSGRHPELLPADGREAVVDLRRRYGLQTVHFQTPYAAQAAELLLDAIAASDGSREGIRRALFEVEVEWQIVGDVRIAPNGDRLQGDATVYVVRGDPVPVRAVEPPPGLVATAASAK
jgi:branched-chain amino acid transport system substrate-binding protein